MKREPNYSRCLTASQLRLKSEGIVGKKNDQASSADESKKLKHELQVHQVELEIQNEQLRLAQAELEQSRDLYLNLYECSPSGYLTIDDNGEITQANLTSTKLLGLDRKFILQNKFSKFLESSEADAWYLAFKTIKSLVPNAMFSIELKLKRKDEEFYANLNCLRVPDDSMHNCVRITITDITKSKEEEFERSAHELLLRNTLVREIHHRIKNTLQGVALLLEQNSADHPELDIIIKKATTQLLSISTTYGLQSDNSMSLIMLNQLISALIINNQRIHPYQFSFNIPSSLSAWELNEKESVPIALVINELLFNAIKHGAVHSKVLIALEENLEKNTVVISITNAGKFIPDAINQNQPMKGTGITLIYSLLPKSGADLSWQQTNGLVTVKLTLGTPVISLVR